MQAMAEINTVFWNGSSQQVPVAKITSPIPHSLTPVAAITGDSSATIITTTAFWETITARTANTSTNVAMMASTGVDIFRNSGSTSSWIHRSSPTAGRIVPRLMTPPICSTSAHGTAVLISFSPSSRHAKQRRAAATAVTAASICTTSCSTHSSTAPASKRSAFFSSPRIGPSLAYSSRAYSRVMRTLPFGGDAVRMIRR